MADADREELRWRVHGERPIYENQWVRLTLVDVEPPAGDRFEHHVVRLQRVALAVVLDQDDRVLMMWRHRFATDEWGWELPGGIVEADEDGESTARREVEEETGWRPRPLAHLVSFQPMPGMVDTPHEVYIGHGAERVGTRPTPRKPPGSNGCRSIRYWHDVRAAVGLGTLRFHDLRHRRVAAALGRPRARRYGDHGLVALGDSCALPAPHRSHPGRHREPGRWPAMGAR